jgi:hypothetical protein
MHKVKTRKGLISKRSNKIDHKFIFTLDGVKIINILEIPNDIKVLIISTEPKFIGVEFENSAT